MLGLAALLLLNFVQPEFLGTEGYGWERFFLHGERGEVEIILSGSRDCLLDDLSDRKGDAGLPRNPARPLINNDESDNRVDVFSPLRRIISGDFGVLYAGGSIERRLAGWQNGPGRSDEIEGFLAVERRNSPIYSLAVRQQLPCQTDAERWRLADILHDSIEGDDDRLRGPVIASHRDLDLQPWPQLGFSGVLRVLQSGATVPQSVQQEEQADSGQRYLTKRQPRQPLGPIGHLPLGVQIVLGALAIAGGGYGTFYALSRSRDRLGLGEAAVYLTASVLLNLYGIAVFLGAVIPSR